MESQGFSQGSLRWPLLLSSAAILAVVLLAISVSVNQTVERESERVEAVARGTLEMDVPDPSRIVPLGVRAGRRAAGRAR